MTCIKARGRGGVFGTKNRNSMDFRLDVFGWLIEINRSGVVWIRVVMITSKGVSSLVRSLVL